MCLSSDVDNAVKDLLALRTAMLDYHVITALLKLSLKPDPDLRKTLLEQKLAAQEAERKAQMEVEAKAAADLAAAAAAEEEARRKEVQAAAAKEAEERRAARAATAAAAAAAATAAAAAATASVQKADDGAAEAGARNVNVTPDRSGPRKREVSKAVSGKESRPQIEAAESLRSPSISRQSSAGGGIIAEEAKRDVGKFC
jgi:Meckel syndrome type 1 protein